MENKQQLQLNNETLASILSNVLGLPSQESLKHGAYVWKKYEVGYEEDEGSTYNAQTVAYGTGYSVPVTIYGSDSYSFDPITGIYTLEGNINSYIVASTVSNPSSGGTDCSHLLYHIVGGTSGDKLIKTTAGWNLFASVSSGTLYLYNGSDFHICGLKSTHVFVDFVVSDSPTAYPDGGEQGGYWYEKVVEGITPELFGCTKMAIDTVTFASDQDFMSGGVKYYLPHSLGEIPKHAILWAQTDITTYVYPGYLQGFDIRKNVGLNAYVCVNWLIQSNNSFKGETRAPSLTADNVFINGGVFKAGVEYKLITMA